MPTPAGKLRKGDHIRHVDSGTTCVVVERHGNDATYSVVLRREDGGQFPPSSGTNRDRTLLLMTEAGYWLGHGWELVS
jgi:hypothetical protein